MADENATEGWQAEAHPSQRRFHYIFETMALCRGFGFYRGKLAPDAGNSVPNTEDCKACFKLLLKRRRDKAAFDAGK